MQHKVLPPSQETKQEKNQNHQSLILFPSLGRWYSRRGGTVTYTPPLSSSWGPPTTPEIELPQGATWRLNALLPKGPSGPYCTFVPQWEPLPLQSPANHLPQRQSHLCRPWANFMWVCSEIHTPRTCSVAAIWCFFSFFPPCLPVCKKCDVWYPTVCRSFEEEWKESVCVWQNAAAC